MSDRGQPRDPMGPPADTEGRVKGSEARSMDAHGDPRVEAALAGDRRAAESIVRELLPRVRTLTRYMQPSDVDADDAAQQACLEILRSLGSWRGDAPLSSWACRVAAHVARGHLRRQRRERVRREEATPELRAVRNDSARPDAYLSRRRLVEMLDELVDVQREAVVLHHVLGWSAPEIAEELDVPFETVRSRLRLGMRKLRALHEAQGDS